MGKKETSLAFAKTIGLIFILYYILIWLILSVLGRIIGFLCPILKNIGFISLIALPISIIAAIITFSVMMKRQKNDPLDQLHSAMKREMRENGFTDKFFEINSQGIELFRQEYTNGSIGYFLEMVVCGSLGYIYKEDYQKALQLINMVDNKALKSRDISFLDGGYSLILYFDSQLNVCYRLQDKGRAERVMEDARPYLEKFRGKNELINMGIDESYYFYYLINQDYDTAKKYAEAILKNPISVREKFVDGYLEMARIYRLTGDMDKESEYINEARNALQERSIPLNQQTFDFYMRERERN